MEFPKINARDVILRAQVRQVSGQNLGLALRCGAAGFLGSFFNGSADGGDFFGIGRKYGDTMGDASSWADLANSQIGRKIQPDQFVEMGFAAIGDTLTLYVDGTKVITVKNNEVASGFIRISALHGRSFFKNVECQILDSVRDGNPKRAASDSLTQDAQTQETFDPDANYQFTNRWQPGRSLGILEDGTNDDEPILADTGNFPGQRWRIIPLGDGRYRITNNSQPGKSLDVRNDGENNDLPVMAQTSDALSQQWSISALHDGWYRITNRVHPGKSVDIVNDGNENNRLNMRDAHNWRGQFWGITVSHDGADSTRPARKDVRSDAGPAVKTPLSQDSITNSIEMTLKRIPAGEFLMGSPDDDKDADNNEKPQHRVRITRPFYLGAYEVTQAQYKAVMGNNRSYFSANGDAKDKVAGESTDQYPVEQVSWFDAVIFCNKLSEKEGRRSFYEIDDKEIRVPDWNGPGYRLPTDAEWEYACRANVSTPTRYSFGDEVAELREYGWFEANSTRTHPVGKKRRNGFGLHDMHGNVSEWCWDWYGEGYYKQRREDDPTGPAPALNRVVRGGSWRSSGRGHCRSAFRGRNAPGDRYSHVGFRLALGQSGR